MEWVEWVGVLDFPHGMGGMGGCPRFPPMLLRDYMLQQSSRDK